MKYYKKIKWSTEAENKNIRLVSLIDEKWNINEDEKLVSGWLPHSRPALLPSLTFLTHHI